MSDPARPRVAPPLPLPSDEPRVRPTNPFVEFTEAEIEQSIPSRFEQQAAKHPDRLAVKAGDRSLTYAELNRLANRVANAIPRRRGRRQQPIALLLEHDAPLIAAILGVSKAGQIYVPLDASHPRARLTHILEDSGARLIVTDHRLRPLAGDLVGDSHQLLDFDAIGPDLPAENPGLAIPPDALAQVLYTSGSTGRPKGVVQNHRNLLHHVRNFTNSCRIGLQDRLTLFSPLGVNTGVRQLFGALLNGASVLPFDVKREGLDRLADWLIRDEITIYFSVATLFRHFAGSLAGRQQFPRLRALQVGSEPVYRGDVELYRQYFNADCILCVSMGITEVGTIGEYRFDHATPFSGNTVPLGQLFDGIEVRLLDEAGRPVGAGEVGELVIKSRYLALGYWRRPDLTRAAFLPDPAGSQARIYRTGDLGRLQTDGSLELLGRQDFQVKVRGHRVEIAEIEQALLDSAALKEAVVVAREHPSGEARLVAYIVPAGEPGPTIRELRRRLRIKLLAHMLPARFVSLEALPLTPTGKVDRRSLPEPSWARPELEQPYLAPRDPLEALLAELWADVLGLERVGVGDEFLALGGDSLLATKLVARVRDALQVDLPLDLLSEAPTIADQTAALVRYRIEQAGDGELARLLDQLEDPLQRRKVKATRSNRYRTGAP